VSDAFAKLPAVMAHADMLGGQIGRAVIDLAEAAMLKGREGETFPAVVTDIDERGARIQLNDLPVVARVDAKDVTPGDALSIRLVTADTVRRSLTFEPQPNG
jgi:exoribonuclease R